MSVTNLIACLWEEIRSLDLNNPNHHPRIDALLDELAAFQRQVKLR